MTDGNFDNLTVKGWEKVGSLRIGQISNTVSTEAEIKPTGSSSSFVETGEVSKNQGSADQKESGGCDA